MARNGLRPQADNPRLRQRVRSRDIWRQESDSASSEETGAYAKRRSADEGMERRKERSKISRGGVDAKEDASRQMGLSQTETQTRNEPSKWRRIGRRDKGKRDERFAGTKNGLEEGNVAEQW